MGNHGYTGSPFKFNSGNAQSGEMFLSHNTCDAVLPGNNGLYVKAPGTWDHITARNNIWVGTTYAINNYNTTQPIDFDYDELWNGDGSDLGAFEYRGGAAVPDMPTPNPELDAYPNPSRDGPAISFQLTRSSDIELAVFDVAGRHAPGVARARPILVPAWALGISASASQEPLQVSPMDSACGSVPVVVENGNGVTSKWETTKPTRAMRGGIRHVQGALYHT